MLNSIIQKYSIRIFEKLRDIVFVSTAKNNLNKAKKNFEIRFFDFCLSIFSKIMLKINFCVNLTTETSNYTSEIIKAHFSSKNSSRELEKFIF
jgi:hypothetical protein